MGVERYAWFGGNEIRMRGSAMWCMCGASEWRSGEVVCNKSEQGSRPESGNDRRVVREQRSSVAKSMDGTGCSAVRVLPIGADHGCSCAAKRKAKSDR